MDDATIVYHSTVDFLDSKDAIEGIVAVGGVPDVGTLYTAYAKGIFPWPVSQTEELLWFSPEERGVLNFKHIKLSKSLLKDIKKLNHCKFTVNQAFEKVILNCQMQLRPGQLGTWITDELLEAYIQFHQAGFAISGEVWQGEELIGGIYGVLVQGAFSGESMFFVKPNASKKALYEMTQYLQSKDVHWMDTQMVTGITESFGAQLIARKEYLQLLKDTQKKWRSQRK